VKNDNVHFLFVVHHVCSLTAQRLLLFDDASFSGLPIKDNTFKNLSVALIFYFQFTFNVYRKYYKSIFPTLFYDKFNFEAESESRKNAYSKTVHFTAEYKSFCKCVLGTGEPCNFSIKRCKYRVSAREK